MKKQLLKTSSHIVLAMVLGLTAAFALRSERAVAQGDSPGGKLEGTWLPPQGFEHRTNRL
jgi:hypothetical protein